MKELGNIITLNRGGYSKGNYTNECALCGITEPNMGKRCYICKYCAAAKTVPDFEVITKLIDGTPHRLIIESNVGQGLYDSKYVRVQGQRFSEKPCSQAVIFHANYNTHYDVYRDYFYVKGLFSAGIFGVNRDTWEVRCGGKSDSLAHYENNVAHDSDDAWFQAMLGERFKLR